MSEFELDKGQELLEVLVELIGSEEGVKQWVKDFAEWVEICYDDGDEDYTLSADEQTEQSDTDDEEPSPEIRGVVVEEEYESVVDESGFHSLKDVAVKDEKKNKGQ